MSKTLSTTARGVLYDIMEDCPSRAAVIPDGFAFFRVRKRTERCFLKLEGGRVFRTEWEPVHTVPQNTLDVSVSMRTVIENAILWDVQELRALRCQFDEAWYREKQAELVSRTKSLDLNPVFSVGPNGVLTCWNIVNDIDMILWPSTSAAPTVGQLMDIWEILHFSRRLHSTKDITPQAIDIHVAQALAEIRPADVLPKPRTPSKRTIALAALKTLTTQEMLRVKSEAVDSALAKVDPDTALQLAKLAMRLMRSFDKMGRISAYELLAAIGWVLNEVDGCENDVDSCEDDDSGDEA